MIDLADEYTDWAGLDTWLEAERALGRPLLVRSWMQRSPATVWSAAPEP